MGQSRTRVVQQVYWIGTASLPMTGKSLKWCGERRAASGEVLFGVCSGMKRRKEKEVGR